MKHDIDDMSNTTDESLISRQNAIAHLLNNRDAKLWLWDVLSQAGIYRMPSHDPHTVVMEAGKRQLGVYIIQTLIDADKLAYIKLQSEALEGMFDV